MPTPEKKTSDPCKDGGKRKKPVKKCPKSDLEKEHEKTIKCILELCKTDPDIVKKASEKLTVHTREPKKIDIMEYDGKKWVKKKTVTSKGSARGNEIWLNRGEKCSQTKATVFHEVRHTDQPDTMDARDREIDAHTATEQWTIDRGLPGNPKKRKVDKDGKVVPDVDAITKGVDRAYGYKKGKPRIVGRSDDGKTVYLEDGTKRPAKAGDKTQHKPPQDLKEKRIPPEKLKCP